MPRISLAALAAILGLGLVSAQPGCASKNSAMTLLPAKIRPVTDITGASYAAADALSTQLKPTLDAETPLLAATVVNLNRLEESSPLGRLIAEQVAGRLAQTGHRMLDVRLRNQIYMKRNEGELVLTREVRDIAKQHNARAIVTGTYVDSSERVFVSLKVIEFDTNVVLAAFDYQLEKDAQLRSLLQSGALMTNSTPR